MRLVRITTVPLSLEKLIAGQMRYMSEHGFEVLMISSDFAGKEELSIREKSIFTPVNMTRTITPLADLAALVELIKIFRNFKPDIVHTHTPKAGLLGMIAAKLSRVPIRLHTVAGLPFMETKGLKRALLEMMERLAYRCSTCVYPNSHMLKNYLLKSGIGNDKKVKVIGNGSSNGINVAEFDLTDEIKVKAEHLKVVLGINESDFTFVFVGRLVKQKGVEELVRAFIHLQRKFNHIKLLLVGGEEARLDPLSLEIRSQISQNSSIIAVGYQHDVRPFLAISNALAFPSYREGFPNVPMQAGCFHLPSIVTDINGCNEIIVNEKNGLIIPAKDISALEKAMDRLVSDPRLYHKMASVSRRMIVDRYEQSKIWKEILCEYRAHLKNEGTI
ncbi:glycosyltransferase family 4 protein [Pedobacter deserti]|uniref:glycosyltransferase family 4 protein n=1 Tax=Pedobacter deserti TaxID=2817382 RepID=UPI00210CDEBB|nr:glycosyltransferase family 4 protein [Pedobacter sp. SYSU D00382]